MCHSQMVRPFRDETLRYGPVVAVRGVRLGPPVPARLAPDRPRPAPGRRQVPRRVALRAHARPALHVSGSASCRPTRGCTSGRSTRGRPGQRGGAEHVSGTPYECRPSSWVTLEQAARAGGRHRRSAWRDRASRPPGTRRSWPSRPICSAWARPQAVLAEARRTPRAPSEARMSQLLHGAQSDLGLAHGLTTSLVLHLDLHGLDRCGPSRRAASAS